MPHKKIAMTKKALKYTGSNKPIAPAPVKVQEEPVPPEDPLNLPSIAKGSNLAKRRNTATLGSKTSLDVISVSSSNNVSAKTEADTSDNGQDKIKMGPIAFTVTSKFAKARAEKTAESNAASNRKLEMKQEYERKVMESQKLREKMSAAKSKLRHSSGSERDFGSVLSLKGAGKDAGTPKGSEFNLAEASASNNDVFQTVTTTTTTTTTTTSATSKLTSETHVAEKPAVPKTSTSRMSGSEGLGKKSIHVDINSYMDAGKSKIRTLRKMEQEGASQTGEGAKLASEKTKRLQNSAKELKEKRAKQALASFRGFGDYTSRAAINIFNQEPKKGLAILKLLNVLDLAANEVGEFITNVNFICKESVGELLGDADPFCIEILKCFSQNFDFTDVLPSKSLRHYQSWFRMPGEAQKIHRILEIFANRYFECNENVLTTSGEPTENKGGQEQLKKMVSTAEGVLVLAYAMIMLNTDLHNHNVKTKMTLEQFCKNIRGAKSCKDLTDNFLTNVYTDLKKTQFEVGQDNTTQLKQIASLIDTKMIFDIVTPTRQFISSYSVLHVKTIGLNGNKEKTSARTVFLFNDVVLICRDIKKNSSRAANGNNPGSGNPSNSFFASQGSGNLSGNPSSYFMYQMDKVYRLHAMGPVMLMYDEDRNTEYIMLSEPRKDPQAPYKVLSTLIIGSLRNGVKFVEDVTDFINETIMTTNIKKNIPKGFFQTALKIEKNSEESEHLKEVLVAGHVPRDPMPITHRMFAKFL